MNPVLVTGANGFVGKQVIVELAAAGWPVRAAVRRPFCRQSLAAPWEELLVDTVGPDTDWSSALCGVEMVIHLAGRSVIPGAGAERALTAFRRVNVEGTRRLARACVQNGVRRILLLSSIRAVGERTEVGQPFSEESPCRPSDAYGISKYEAEQALLEEVFESGVEPVILRAPLVYGPGVGANFLRLMKAIDRRIPLPLGRVENKRSLIFISNLTNGIMHCVAHPLAAGQVFHVADAEPLSTPELMNSLGDALERRVRLLSVPACALRSTGRLLGRVEEIRRLTGSLEMTIDKIRKRLGWAPPFTTRAGLEAVAAWYRAGVGRRTERDLPFVP